MSAVLPELAHALGWAVTHFLWQGALVGLITAGALRLCGRDAVVARYWVACGGLLASLVAFTATASLAMPGSARSEALLDVPVMVAMPVAELAALLEVLPEPKAEPLGFAGPVALLWALGVLFMGIRLARGGLWVRRLHRAGAALDANGSRLEEARRMVAELSSTLGVRRRVRVLCSEVVESPLVVGWLRPVILVPTATWAALTVTELRAILAHELAHVRRHDPIVNAVQALVEALLFFHPVVWWLSRVIRDERELCCDLIAVQASRDPHALATGLTRLEALRLSYSQVALAAKTPRGSLMTRIQRILDQRADVHSLARSRRISAPRTLLLAVFGAVTLGLGVGNAAALPRAAATSSALSLEGRDAGADYAVIEARVLQAVSAGELSAQDAKKTLSALRRTMFVVEERALLEWAPVEEEPTVMGRDVIHEGAATDSMGRGDVTENLERLKALEARLHQAQQELHGVTGERRPVAVGVELVPGQKLELDRRVEALDAMKRNLEQEFAALQRQHAREGVQLGAGSPSGSSEAVVEGQPIPMTSEELSLQQLLVVESELRLRELGRLQGQAEDLMRGVESQRVRLGVRWEEPAEPARDLDAKGRDRLEAHLKKNQELGEMRGARTDRVLGVLADVPVQIDPAGRASVEARVLESQRVIERLRNQRADLESRLLELRKKVEMAETKRAQEKK